MTTANIATLQAENQRLQAQVATLEQERDRLSAEIQWMQAMLEQSNLPICYWEGSNLVFHFANQTYLDGSAKNDAIGKKLREVFSEAEVADLLDVVELAYHSGTVQTVEDAPLHLKNVETGEYEDLWYKLIFTPLRNTTGDIIGVSQLGVDVTEQVRQQEALKLTQFALDRAADTVLWHDQAGQVVYANEAACSSFGYTRDELLRMRVPELDPNFTLEAAQNLWKALEEQGFITIETRHQRKDGSTFPTEVTINPLSYDDREYMCVFARDITERKAFEAEQRRFKALADYAVDGIAMSDAEARLIYTNQAFQQMLGRSETELYGAQVVEFYPPEVHAFIGETAVPTIYAQGAWQGVVEMEHSSGKRILVQHSAFALRDENGAVTNVANILRDVTAEREDAQTLQRYAEIIERTSDGIASAGEQANILMMNPAFRRMVGLEADSEPQHYYIADFHPAWALEKITGIGIPTAIRDGTWADETALINRQTGTEIPISQVIISHKKPDGSLDFVSTIIRDLTQQKQAERSQAELQQQIIEAQRQALRELSTPLIPISDEVVIMPLIGTIDSGRAQQVMETLLEGVAEHQASLVILDITGVAVVDTQVAQSFIQAAQAVRLLGAQVMITGIQPHIAQTLVSLGVDLSGIGTRSTLQSGIASALQR